MAFVVSVENFRPTPRHDGVLWTQARLEESLSPTGPWSALETFSISSYGDAAAPPELDFTSDVGTINPDIAYYRVVFLDGGGNVNESEPIGPSGYPTTEELVSESTVTALTSLTEVEQDALRASSITAIEEFCNQSFSYEPNATYRCDGNGTGVLYLPRRAISITAITVPDSAVVLSDVLLNSDGDRLFVSNGITDPLAHGYYSAALRSFDDVQWPMKFTFGSGNIIITGNWGWASVPNYVKIAIRKDMEDTALADANGLSQTARAFRKLGLRDVSQGNLRASVTGAWGLSPDVMALLDRYVWMGPLGAVT